MMTRTAPVKPRNPFVALARSRRAGTHRPGVAAGRQEALRSMRGELIALKTSIP